MRKDVRGWQVAFLVFAVVLLSVPASRWVVRLGDIPPEYAHHANRVLPFVVATVLISLISGLRRNAIALLRTPIPPERTTEAIIVSSLKPVFLFAAAGGIAAWTFAMAGPEGVERMMANARTPDDQWAEAVTPFGIFWNIAMAGLVGPFIEELVFRGFLQGTWERRWGWFPAVVMTSAVFGFYHPHFFAAFTSGIVFSCLYRRTGSLWAPIACHMVGNLSLWYPILGRFVFPVPSAAQGDPGTWWLQLACLLVTALFVPAYLVLSAYTPREIVSSTEVLEQPA